MVQVHAMLHASDDIGITAACSSRLLLPLDGQHSAPVYNTSPRARDPARFDRSSNVSTDTLRNVRPKRRLPLRSPSAASTISAGRDWHPTEPRSGHRPDLWHRFQCSEKSKRRGKFFRGPGLLFAESSAEPGHTRCGKSLPKHEGVMLARTQAGATGADVPPHASAMNS